MNTDADVQKTKVERGFCIMIVGDCDAVSSYLDAMIGAVTHHGLYRYKEPELRFTK